MRVDLLVPTQVSGVKLQHRGDLTPMEYVTGFYFKWSNDNSVWNKAFVGGIEVCIKCLDNVMFINVLYL